MLPLLPITSLVLGLLKGPLSRVLESYVSDLELRRKLQAELESRFLTELGKSEELAAGIVLAEVNSEHWLTRSWRPLLMLLLMGFLLLVGAILPFADLIAGHPIRFEPRWSALPPEFWSFLAIGMGGYVGGRSLEKVAGMVMGGDSARNWSSKWERNSRYYGANATSNRFGRYLATGRDP